MKRFRVLKTSVVAVALVVGLMPAPSAHAVGAGALVITNGEADLPSFPCDPGPCSASFDGDVALGTLAGSGTSPHVVVGTTGTVAANVSYSEPALTCPLQGSANGNGNFNGSGIDVAQGGATVAVSGGFSYNYTRVGAVAVVTLSGVNASVGNDQVINGGLGAAVLLFTAPPDQAALNCLAGGGPLHVTLNGAAVFAGL